MRTRIIAASTAVVVAGAIAFGGVSAASADTTSAAPDPAVSASTSASPTGPGAVLAPVLEQLVASGASPASPETAAELSLAAAGPGSLQTDAQGRLVVTATFRALDDTGLAAVGALGEVIAVSPVLPKVTVAVPTASLRALAAVEGVTGVAADLAGRTASASAAAPAAVAPTPAPASCRSVPVDVDPGLRSAAARERFGVDGTGVTVGIMSDSFSTNADALTTWADDIALGVLPGAGNPCGHVQPVELVGPAQPVGTDEGRGMAQMVHGVAPGARLLFAPGDTSPSQFAASVIALTDAGADVIVDDISYPNGEPFFQEGELSLAIDYAVGHGVLYVSAADNFSEFGMDSSLPDFDYAIGGWESTVYTPTDCPTGIATAIGTTAIDCHNFGTATDPDASNEIYAVNTTTATPSFDMVLNWMEPVNGVTGNYIVALVDRDTGAVVATGARTDNSLPISSFSAAVAPTGGVYDVVVARQLDQGYSPVSAGFKFIFPNDEAGTVEYIEHYENTETVTVGPTVFGHTADADVLSVGAASWRTPTFNEAFSSLGPVKHVFGPVKADGTASERLAAPEVRSKPDLTSLDGAQTSFFEPPVASDGNYYFSGTSAASPNAAAVAALALQYSPQSSADEVKRAMTATAVPLTNLYKNMADRDVYGAGLLDAEAALAALPAAPAPTPTPAPAGDGGAALAATGAGDPLGGERSAGGLLAALALMTGAALLALRRSLRTR